MSKHDVGQADEAARSYLYDVFLSHNSSDKAQVETLATRLAEQARLRPFLDKWHLVPGEPWQEALEKALDESRTCAVFLGASGLGSWENEEMRAALDERVQKQDFRVIPVLLPGTAPTTKESLPRFLRRVTWVEFRHGLDDEDAFRRLVAGIRGQQPGPVAALEDTVEPLPKRLRPLLPYLCDRSEQENMLVTELRRQQQEKARRPLVCLIHGNEQECHSDYLERLRYYTLPKLLNLEARQQSVREYQLEWPLRATNPKDFESRLWQQLGAALLENSMATRAEIFDFIAHHEEPMMLNSHLLTEDFAACGETILSSFLSFCNDWPDLPPGRVVFHSVCLKYQSFKNVGLFDFKKKKLRQLNERLRALLAELNFARWSGLHGLVLPELSAIPRRDAESWSRNALVRKHCQIREQEISRLYERAELCNDDGHIAMELLAEELRQLMERRTAQ